MVVRYLQVWLAADPITTMKELVVDLQKYDKSAYQELRSKAAQVRVRDQNPHHIGRFYGLFSVSDTLLGARYLHPKLVSWLNNGRACFLGRVHAVFVFEPLKPHL
jgi:hypothetical protein